MEWSAEDFNLRHLSQSTQIALLLRFAKMHVFARSVSRSYYLSYDSLGKN
ncbi:unnamed protein product [Oikopleura dioica]|uniref:Uncharacterized protein n=1 Tax=Oikopleura dioica TaxID=34765 RepID=E4YRJ6_OIKDI|nr:unnamed protein product [Oikopleura dioica]